MLDGSARRGGASATATCSLVVADTDEGGLRGARRPARRRRRGRQKLVDESRYAFCWVTDFPLVGCDDDDGTWFPMNHPFTAPREEDLPLLETDPGRVRARAYDVVVNGWELGCGLDPHPPRRPPGARLPAASGSREAEGRERFGFLLDALRFGAPPHGGIALGPRPDLRDRRRRDVASAT